MGRVVGGFNFFFVVDWISSLLSRACCEVMAMVGLLCFNIQVISHTCQQYTVELCLRHYLMFRAITPFVLAEY